MSDLLKDGKGNTSSMRVAVITCIIIGSIISLGGLVGWFMKQPDAILMVGSGEGFMVLAIGAKAWQKQIEEKKE